MTDATVPEAEVSGTTPGETLTERELQVLRGIARGDSNTEIGIELALSEDTVKTHCRTLYRKLGVHARAQAVAVGYEMQLLGAGASTGMDLAQQYAVLRARVHRALRGLELPRQALQSEWRRGYDACARQVRRELTGTET